MNIQKKNANKDQINQFLSAYYSEWRHIRILSIKKNLHDKYDFFQSITEEIKDTDTSSGEKTIAQEITNGLNFEAIQQSVQYIEDLFAFINATTNEEYFIRSIIKYNAGKIERSIINFKNNRRSVCKYFNFPYYEDSTDHSQEEKGNLKVINEGLDRLGAILLEITEFYKKHQFFYNQYKHGLTVALRPFKDYDKNQIDSDKNGNPVTKGVIALDSLNFKNALEKKNLTNCILFMPAFSDDVRACANLLQKENNLLRYVMSPEGVDIDKILAISSKTKRCLQILIHNFRSRINDVHHWNLRLPAEDSGKVYSFTIEVDN